MRAGKASLATACASAQVMSHIGRASLGSARPAAGGHPEENAETLLRKLIERNEPRYELAAYILAVMLERKRLLRVKEQIQREGRAFLCMNSRRPATCLPSPIPICI